MRQNARSSGSVVASTISAESAFGAGVFRRAARRLQYRGLMGNGGEPADGEDALVKRLRRAAKPQVTRPRSDLPGRPTAHEFVVETSDVSPKQREFQPVTDANLCGNEGWIWLGVGGAAGVGGDIPASVWCSRPLGHLGLHEARAGRSFRHPRKIRIARWETAEAG